MSASCQHLLPPILSLLCYQNPIGVKVSDKMDPRDIVTMIAKLNPDNTPGRLTIIVRMGAKAMREKLPKLVEAVQQAGQVVVWVTDPMHGNTETVSGYKTRRFDNIRAEIEVGGADRGMILMGEWGLLFSPINFDV